MRSDEVAVELIRGFKQSSPGVRHAAAARNAGGVDNLVAAAVDGGTDRQAKVVDVLVATTADNRSDGRAREGNLLTAEVADDGADRRAAGVIDICSPPLPTMAPTVLP
jgi:hypothetical protein